MLPLALTSQPPLKSCYLIWRKVRWHIAVHNAHASGSVIGCVASDSNDHACGGCRLKPNFCL
jgi:hypothetical protein